MVEAGTDPGRTKQAVRLALSLRDELRLGILSALSSSPGRAQPIELRLFRNRASYEAYARRASPLPTYAHFARKEMRIYISVDAPRAAFLHELTHALIETERPGTPYWLHEGLAGFAQTNPARADCGQPRQAGLAAEHVLIVRDLVPQLRPKHGAAAARLVVPFGLSCSARRLDRYDRLLAEHLFLYIQRRRALGKFLSTWRGSRGPEEALQKALGGDCAAWSQEFLEWLERSGVEEETPGC